MSSVGTLVCLCFYVFLLILSSYLILSLILSPIVADQVALRKSLRFHNKKAAGKTGVLFPVHDFRLRLIFGYGNRSDSDDKFSWLVSAQNELCHSSFHIKSDHSTMKRLSFRHREYLWRSFRLTPDDVLELALEVNALIEEFEEKYDV